MNETFVDIGLFITYALIGIAALGFIFSEIFFLIKNIKEAKNTLIGIGVLILILVISYAIGSGESIAGTEKFELSSGTYKIVDSGLFATYTLLAVAFLAMIADLVLGFVRR